MNNPAPALKSDYYGIAELLHTKYICRCIVRT